MNFTTHIDNKGSILYWQPEAKYRINSNKILGMDLDWTIIKPIKGKIHPEDHEDWEFFTDDFTEIKAKYNNGYKFVIFTNQITLIRNSTGRLNVEGFIKRWDKIYDKFIEFGIPSVYIIASLYDDFYRKPCTGMWEFVETELNNNIKVDRSKCLFVGDMAGRKKDHTPTDLQFALNLGVKFMVPEVFYYNDSSVENKTKTLIEKLEKNDKIFNPTKYLQELKTGSYQRAIVEINNIIQPNKQYLIISVGSPASGKTLFYNSLLKKRNDMLVMSQDTFDGTPAKFLKSVNSYLLTGGNNIEDVNYKNVLVIDNTNGTKQSRMKLIDIANKNNVETIIVNFNMQKSVIMHINEIRNKLITICELNKYTNCKKTVPTVAINTYWKRYEEPNKEEEGFDKIINVDFEAIFMENIKEADKKQDISISNIKNLSITKEMFISYV
jgi:bifunctional polynucleotide phosphatase/kinase